MLRSRGSTAISACWGCDMSYWPDVNPGQVFQPSAQLENDVRHLVNQGGLAGVRANGGGVNVENICINAYNPGTTAIVAGTVVTFIDAAMVEGAVQVAAMTAGSSATEWAIAQDTIESHQFGSVLVMGAVIVPITGETGDYAVPVGGGGSFARSTTGIARILRTIGTASALILVGSASGGGGGGVTGIEAAYIDELPAAIVTGGTGAVKFEGDGTVQVSLKARRYASAEEIAEWGRRYNPATGEMDGDPKNAGWRGIITLANGDIMTEYGMSREFDGEEIGYPLIVPTTTDAELEIIAQAIIQDDESLITQAIEDKAVAWALDRIGDGLSPFYNGDAADEQIRVVEDDTILIRGSTSGGGGTAEYSGPFTVEMTGTSVCKVYNPNNSLLAGTVRIGSLSLSVSTKTNISVSWNAVVYITVTYNPSTKDYTVDCTSTLPTNYDSLPQFWYRELATVDGYGVVHQSYWGGNIEIEGRWCD